MQEWTVFSCKPLNCRYVFSRNYPLSNLISEFMTRLNKRESKEIRRELNEVLYKLEEEKLITKNDNIQRRLAFYEKKKV